MNSRKEITAECSCWTLFLLVRIYNWRLEAAKEKCKAQSKTVLGGLLFTCGGRGIPFCQRKSGGESTLFKNAMPDNVGLSGFFAGGEIGPEALAMQNVNNDFEK